MQVYTENYCSFLSIELTFVKFQEINFFNDFFSNFLFVFVGLTKTLKGGGIEFLITNLENFIICRKLSIYNLCHSIISLLRLSWIPADCVYRKFVISIAINFLSFWHSL